MSQNAAGDRGSISLIPKHRISSGKEEEGLSTDDDGRRGKVGI